MVLLSIDTLRADVVFGPDGPLRAQTPHLDALREQGFGVPFALTCSSQTVPGHATMLTGMGVQEHGALGNRYRLKEGASTLASQFAEEGWQTAGFVANPILNTFSGLSQGFEHWSMVAHNDAHTLDRLEAHLANSEASRPQFLFLNWMAPHQPYDADAPFRNRRAGDFRVGLSQRLKSRLDRQEDSCDQSILRRLGGIFLGKTQRFSRGAMKLAWTDEEKSAKSWMQARYLECVEEADARIGELRAILSETGRPWLLVVTSDHGEHLGEHGLVLHANSLYEELLRVPLVISGPALQDWPTDSLTVEPWLEDLAPFLLKSQEPYPSQRQLLFARDPRYAAVRGEGWKWIRIPREGDTPLTAGLFELRDDPHELRDLRDTLELPAELVGFFTETLQNCAVSPQSEQFQNETLLDELGYGKAE